MVHDGRVPVLALLEQGDEDGCSLIAAAAFAGWRCVMLHAWRAGPATATIVVAAARHVSALSAERACWPGTGLIAITDAIMDEADETISARAGVDECNALLARWQPLSLPPAVSRQVEVFGADNIGPLLLRLRLRLKEVLGAEPAQAQDAAHQLAGLAGILGFADVGTRWNEVSRDGMPALSAARRETRRALAAIDRSGICAEQH